MTKMPETAHAMRQSPGEPARDRATPGLENMPEPMMMPHTIPSASMNFTLPAMRVGCASPAPRLNVVTASPGEGDLEPP